MDRSEMGEGGHHEKPHSHVCSAIVPIILLGFFSHYLNYSANENLGTCWSSTSVDGLSGASPVELPGYINVTEEWRTLILVGIVWASVHLGVVGIIVAIPKLGLMIQGLNSCLYLAWLITATVFRWNTAGKNCSQTPMLETEGKFLKNLTLSLWGIPACLCVLGCLGGICAAICGNKRG